MPLAEVPDALFSSGAAGPGQAIDPTGQLLVAPCSGEVIHLHRCQHALTLRRSDGVEILLHLGIDTFALNGQGFRALVRPGDQVETGTPLVEFDSDLVIARARSLISVFVVLENPRVSGLRAQAGQVRQGEDWMTFQLEEQAGELVGGWLQLPNPAGMHARPAARLLQLVRPLPGQVYVESRQARASARSMVAVLTLDLGYGDSLRLVSTALTRAQLAELEAEILAGLGDDLQRPTAAPAPLPTPVADGDQLTGVIVCGGLALGPVHHWQRPEFDLQNRADHPGQEERRWQKALRQAATGIEEILARAPLQQQGIFAAQRELLQDPSLVEECRRSLRQGQSAALSWHQAYQSQAARLEALANPVLASRANDLRDVGERVLRALLGQPAAQPPPEGCILVSSDLYPSEILQLDSSRIQGICLSQGGAGSHLAVLLRSRGLPALCNLGEACRQLTPGTPVILDADHGILWSRPSPEQLQSARQRLQAQDRQGMQARLAVQDQALTRDQQRVLVGLNGPSGELVVPPEVDFLLYPFEVLGRDLVALAGAVGPNRRLILKLPAGRANLGEALRACGELCKLGLLIPMATSRQSWRSLRAEFQGGPAELGLLVEVPATAMLADQLAPEADFLMLDPAALVRHTLALERARPELMAAADPLHPAVLRLMQRVGEAAEGSGKPLILNQSQDREALPLWLGLPVDHLAVEPAALAATKADVRRWSRSECRGWLSRALELGEPEEVRQFVRQNLSAVPGPGYINTCGP
jgi:glucose-specific phosphotransferase system IIA component